MQCVFCDREIDANAQNSDATPKHVLLEVEVKITDLIPGVVPNKVRMDGPAHQECAWTVYTLIRKLRIRSLG